MFNLGILIGVVNTELTYVETNSTDYKVATMILATKKSYPDEDGKFSSDYYEVTFYNQVAEFYVGKYQVGDKIIVRGKLSQANYTKDEKTYYHIKLIGETISLV